MRSPKTSSDGTLAIATALLATLAGLPVQQAYGDDAADPRTRDLIVLVDWFEGEFDNEEQRWFENDPRSATPDADRVIRLHTIHKRIDAPTFGENVFYIEEYADNDPDNVIRQRLVSFSSDADIGAIRMQQGFFKDAKQLKGAHVSPERLADLEPDDVTFLSECDVFWQRDGGQYKGAMAEKACVFGDGDTRRYSVHNLTLSADDYWRVDTTFLLSDDSLHVGYPIDRPVRMRRSRIFYCDVYFYGEPGESGIVKDLRLHSQGGLLNVVRESDGAGFDVLMRDKQYPYYDTRPDFIYFSIRPAGEQRSIAFSVNDPNSRQLGIRTTEIGAFCHRQGYQFHESIAELP